MGRNITYRERALKMFPWICGRCAREFQSSNLRELTVHHRDHNHLNNRSNGSNWELLCLYCHDDEHSRSLRHSETLERQELTVGVYKPFLDIDKFLKG